MKLGTHNSMSYLPLQKWYMKPFNFIAKCQKLDIKEQYEHSTRLFDIRINFGKYDIPEFRHGIIAYQGNVDSVFEYLNSLNDKGIYIRLILEDNSLESKEKKQFSELLFKAFCAEALVKYKNLKLYGGNRKSDWEVLYKFPRKDLNVKQIVGSMTGNFLNTLCPYLYAKYNNKKNLMETKKNEWVLMDFIEIT